MPARSPLILLLAISALALGAAPAGAKGVQSLRVCGADDCASTARGSYDEADFDENVIFGGGSAASPPAGAEPFYRVTLDMVGVPADGSLHLQVLPKSGLIHSRDQIGGAEWTRMTTEQAGFYGGLARDLQPVVTRTLPGPSNPQLRSSSSSRSGLEPATAADEGTGFPWLIALAVLAALAAVALALGLARRPARSAA